MRRQINNLISVGYSALRMMFFKLLALIMDLFLINVKFQKDRQNLKRI